jgi:AcrR family transcriptional regulator
MQVKGPKDANAKYERRSLTSVSRKPARRLDLRPSMPTKKITKRVRRTADDARREILDAAEAMLRDLGPAGIRLHQIADDVGVSHPAILHHFGSREGLIEAVVNRAVERLESDLIEAIAASPQSSEKPLQAELIDRAFEVLVGGGHARVVAWLLLSGQWHFSETRVRAIALASHQRRLELAGGDASAVTFEDTAFRLILVALTIFGEAIAGDTLRQSAGFPDAGAADRFREWLIRLLGDGKRP